MTLSNTIEGPHTLNGSDNNNSLFEQIQARYAIEREKRLRPGAVTRYFDIAKSDKFKHLTQDPWTRWTSPSLSRSLPIHDGAHSKVLVVGAGYGALMFAVRLILEANFTADDIVFVDSGAGFGGTWYWNRYPGLMCDIESACYLPLLEESGYIPKHRFGYGPELREYAELVASKWNLTNRALFKSTAKEAVWDETASQWRLTIEREVPSGPNETWEIRSDFLILASGIINRPKMPDFPGLDSYTGHIFHTSRWDYAYTGGAPENPEMRNLKGKRVAFIGTGSTAVQAIPELARWAGHLYVFQRTPSAVDVRDQRTIDAEKWLQEVARNPGWQKDRRENLSAFFSNAEKLPEENMVKDGWTYAPSLCALSGSPQAEKVTEDNLQEYLDAMHRLDLPRQEKIRARVDEVVHSTELAGRLKPWYASWCKRPCFHDGYLQTFNLPNVELVDTDGKGVDGFSATGVLFNDQEYEVDLIILGTGFESFVIGSPAFRAGMSIIGRDGLSMDDKWEGDLAILHGLLVRGFPNLFLSSSLSQAGASWNNVHTMDIMARHAAFILAQADKKLSGSIKGGKKIVIEPTRAAEEAWSAKVVQGAHVFAPIGTCLPSYSNAADLDAASAPNAKEQKLKLLQRRAWPKGVTDFSRTLEDWQNKGDLEGLDLRVVGVNA
jgi:cation diffusion facilitator CzcD-associated flavoprotein CzcO